MRMHIFATLFVAPLCACATGPGGTWATPTGTGATVVAAVESPLYFAFKGPVCVLRTPALIPSAIASAVVPFAKSKEGSGVDYLSNNAVADCGPPYWVSPSQVSNEP
ncbi:MAG TPA: hypothetical protein VGF92_05965 [Stellaceae bacterium]